MASGIDAYLVGVEKASTFLIVEASYSFLELLLEGCSPRLRRGDRERKGLRIGHLLLREGLQEGRVGARMLLEDVRRGERRRGWFTHGGQTVEARKSGQELVS